MEDTFSSVIEYITNESLEAGVTKVMVQLKADCEQQDKWKSLYRLIESNDKLSIDAKQILELCICYLTKPDSVHCHARIVNKILVHLIENVVISEDSALCIQSFLHDVETSIICQSNTNQLHENCKLDYETATTTMSLLLPSIIKANLLQDSHKTVKVIKAMVNSRNEKSLVEALAFMLPCIINLDQTHFQSVCESIQQLFQAEKDKLDNCPGLVALCSIADILFSNSYQHKVFEDDWFLKSIQKGLSSLVGLNRKRCQYLLKRYVDSTSQQQVELFDDFFLILETFEERQLHIVQPVLSKLEALEERILVKKELDPSWLCSIYCRMLSHDNLQLIKIGLHKVCHLQLELWPGFGNDEHWLYDLFLSGLNTVIFYVREDKTNQQQLPVFGKDLVQLMQKCSTLPAERSGFFHLLLKGMSRVPWNSVGLFHLCYALASVPTREEFVDGKMLRVVLEFLRSALYNQHPLLRGAIQCLLLEFVLNATEISQENLLWVAHILATLERNECYVRNSVLHTKLKTWIRERFTSSQLGEVLDKLIGLYCELVRPNAESSGYSVDVTTLARFSVLLLDADSMDSKALQQLQSSLEPLAHCHTRMYANGHIISQRMRLMATLLDESGNSIAVQRLVAPLVESVVHYCLNQIESSTDYSVICECLAVLDSIAPTDLLVAVGRVETIIRHLLHDKFSSPVAKFKGVSLLRFLPDGDNLIQHMIQLKMHCCPPKREEDTLREVTWGAFMSHYFTNVWLLLEQRLPHLKVNAEEFVEEAASALDLAGVEAIKCIQRCLVHLLPLVCNSNPDLCRSTLRQCWTICYDYRRSDHFWSLMRHFTDCAFQSSLLEQPELRPHLFQYLTDLKLQGENIMQLFNLAAARVVSIWIETQDTFPTVDDYSVQFIVDLVTFGLLHRKDEVVQFETCAFVRFMGERCPANVNIRSEDVADSQVRYQGLRFLLSLKRSDERHMTMARKLTDAFLIIDEKMSKEKKRYFASSHGHRLKHRMWVAMLILQDMLTDFGMRIMEAAIFGLVEDNPQPSVRFLQEWSVVRAIHSSAELENAFWKAMDAAVEQRAGAMVSFLAIVGHSARCLLHTQSDDRLLHFATNALPRVLPWAMAQHYTPRLYGCVVVDMVWNVCQASGKMQSLLDQYSMVRQMLQSAPEMPNTQRNIEKLTQDFYLSVFHPLEHFTLETLCYHLPRLAHLVADEWMAVQWFDTTVTWIPKRNTDTKLAECQPAEWVAKAAGGGPLLAAEEAMIEQTTSAGHIQKKITPWKQMLPDVDSLAVSSAAAAGRKKSTQSTTNDLIVIASLIDRVPNLGGLCRTCEVLGAKQFVISTLRVTEEKDFSSLSVSAEKWIKVTEVKPFQLVDYMKQLKVEGYSVVGAEQTSGSVSMNTFKFPRKTALLLGHEKEGIPVELIQHLDFCVEVPQAGIIRSMNVHVTGAIFIWEYVRQQMGLPQLG